MATIRVGEENSAPVEISYEDLGSGRPVVLVHGFPVSGRSFEKVTVALLDAGYRVVAYDRRGFGRSSQPSTGYEFATWTADLHQLMESLDLHDATLVGVSMGAGEVAHYLGTHGSGRVRSAALLSGITPYLLKSDDNPDGGATREFIDGLVEAIRADRFAFLAEFLQNYYNVDELRGTRMSEQAVHDSWGVAAGASAIATAACPPTWLTDFRSDLERIDVPVLVVHGDADRIVPIEASSRRVGSYLKDCSVVEIAGAPHGMLWTHAAEVNAALLPFLAG
jgi:non-heme chloroperoxidase